MKCVRCGGEQFKKVGYNPNGNPRRRCVSCGKYTTIKVFPSKSSIDMDRKKKIDGMKKLGFTLKDIGKVFGLSKQRIKQILDTPAPEPGTESE